MRIALPISAVVLMFLVSSSRAQETAPAIGLFDTISIKQTNQERLAILEKLDLESLVRQRLETGPQYVAIAGISLAFPGVDGQLARRGKMDVAPLTGCLIPATMTKEQFDEWIGIATSYALRWNLLMRHFEAKLNPNLKPAISLAEIQSYYRIEDEVFKLMSLESKLMMQHTMSRFVSMRNRVIDLEELLEENDIFEPLK